MQNISNLLLRVTGAVKRAQLLEIDLGFPTGAAELHAAGTGAL
jgi:hypothetical protein